MTSLQFGRSRTVCNGPDVSYLNKTTMRSGAHVFELSDVGSRYVNERGIRLNNAAVDKRSHAEMVALHSRNALQLTARKDQSAKVLINDLQKRLG